MTRKSWLWAITGMCLVSILMGGYLIVGEFIAPARVVRGRVTKVEAKTGECRIFVGETSFGATPDACEGSWGTITASLRNGFAERIVDDGRLWQRPAAGRWVMLFLGGFMIAVGTGLWIVANRRRRTLV